MITSGVNSGYQMIQLSNQMADEASRELNPANQQPRDDLSFNRVDRGNEAQQGQLNNGQEQDQQQQNSASRIVTDPQQQQEALLKLNQATGYNRIGASVVERNQEVIGSLLDIQA